VSYSVRIDPAGAMALVVSIDGKNTIHELGPDDAIGLFRVLASSLGKWYAKEPDDVALEAARLAVEQELIEWRDMRMSVLTEHHGFVVREPDGEASSIIRLSTRDGLRLGVKAYLAAMPA
jgi:hypothetical protein